MLTDATDVELPGVLPLVLRRAYASGYATGRLFGPGWSSTLDQRLSINEPVSALPGTTLSAWTTRCPPKKPRCCLSGAFVGRWYDEYSNNCLTFCTKTMSAGGLDVPTDIAAMVWAKKLLIGGQS